MEHFKLVSKYQPTGDQPQAIEALVKGFQEGNQFQTLLGVTGSGKTFTMANVIRQLNKPTLIISHNKTLAAQLYGEFKEFFRRMQWNILFPIMIIISRRHMCRRRILISQKIRRSMRKLINCACLRRLRVGGAERCYRDSQRFLYLWSGKSGRLYGNDGISASGNGKRQG